MDRQQESVDDQPLSPDDYDYVRDYDDNSPTLHFHYLNRSYIHDHPASYIIDNGTVVHDHKFNPAKYINNPTINGNQHPPTHGSSDFDNGDSGAGLPVGGSAAGADRGGG